MAGVFFCSSSKRTGEQTRTHAHAYAVCIYSCFGVRVCGIKFILHLPYLTMSMSMSTLNRILAVLFCTNMRAKQTFHCSCSTFYALFTLSSFNTPYSQLFQFCKTTQNTRPNTKGCHLFSNGINNLGFYNAVQKQIYFCKLIEHCCFMHESVLSKNIPLMRKCSLFDHIESCVCAAVTNKSFSWVYFH